MRVAIMQPYFLPYLGYWQLICAVDKFVILDDVNYINHGFINSNRILINGTPHKFSISLKNKSQNKLIKDIKLFFPDKERQSFIKMIEMAYKRAGYFSDVFPLIKTMAEYGTDDLTEFIENSIQLCMTYLNIDTEVLVSSKINKNPDCRGEERIIALNKALHADTYINAIGGKSLYAGDSFRREGIELYFIQMDNIEYEQGGEAFVPNLSIIDVMMHNSVDSIKDMLTRYQLVN